MLTNWEKDQLAKAHKEAIKHGNNKVIDAATRYNYKLKIHGSDSQAVADALFELCEAVEYLDAQS